ncbi:hypothetical protein [Sinorhizobium meliloti]|uniref:hypothetical protein n=1 Tax=Rhizobium meliloti TaxID=382 RepID=UPI0001E4AB59|nr:hypothetical protein [Sinorhizobium meliloti]AEG53142.1 hypothetical protein Sinme_1395 [Sinorhizobium meliloti AK83]MDE4591143.1 hypothetical protein [Sinorhizobium meliloti]SEI55962.1 hypothetical protein SAMN04244575_01043 [Sinorhizobium meliloti]
MTASTTTEAPVFTQQTLLDMLDAFSPEPMADPLNGATILWVTPEQEDKAKQIVAAAARPIHVRVSPNAFPKRIYGFRGPERMPCLVIKNEDSK